MEAERRRSAVSTPEPDMDNASAGNKPLSMKWMSGIRLRAYPAFCFPCPSPRFSGAVCPLHPIDRKRISRKKKGAVYL